MKISLTNVLKLSFAFLLTCLFVNDTTAQVRVTINNTDLAGNYDDRVGEAGFDVPVFGTFSGDLALGFDATAPESDACEPIVNGADISGKVALVDRGACNFTLKVMHAADAGAVAVLICNNATMSESRGGAMGMGPNSEDNLIPTISFHKEFCDELKIRMASETVNITVTDQFNVLGCSAAYSTQTPADQVQELQDIRMLYSNMSGVDQLVPAYCEITDPSGATVMITDTFELPPNDQDPDTGDFDSWILTFTDTYNPTMLGEYSARFWVNGSEINDVVEGVNDESLTFRVTENIFSNDNGNNDDYRRSFLLVDGNIDIGTVIPVTAATDALSVSFAIGDPLTLTGETLTFVLYRLDPNGDGNIDENGDEIFSADDTDPTDELHQSNTVAVGTYTIGGSEVPNDVINVPLFNFVDPSAPSTPLESGHYFLKMEYVGSNSLDPTTTHDAAISPSANMFVGEDTATVGGTFVGDDDQWFLGGFAGDPQFILHLNTSNEVNVDLPELDDSQVALMPNPASETVNIVLDLSEIAETAEIQLLDIMGRTIESQIHNNVKDQVFTMDVSSLTAGTYFVNVVTDEGRKIMRLAVSK